MKNSKKLKNELSGNNEEKLNSLSDQAKLKAGTHFQRKDVAAQVASDDELVKGRVRNSTKSINEAIDRFDDAADILFTANGRLLSEAERVIQQSKKACSSVKSTVNEIKDQLNKVDTILGDNVEHKVKQLERIADALKTINELSSDKKTMGIISSMVNKNDK